MGKEHTAGQWKFDSKHNAICEGEAYNHFCKTLIATINPNMGSESICNAKIMAAAPELLQTLTDYIHSMLQPDHVEKWYNQYKDDETANRVLVNAITAIKAATI